MLQADDTLDSLDDHLKIEGESHPYEVINIRLPVLILQENHPTYNHIHHLTLLSANSF